MTLLHSSRMRFLRSALVAPFLVTAAWAASPLVGDWTFDDGRTVTLREDRTAEISSADGVQMDVGEWKMDTLGGCTIAWKNGDRHFVRMSADGGALRGSLQTQGRGGSQKASAERAQVVEEDTAAYFGSASPTGGLVQSGPAIDAEETDEEHEESEPPAMEEDVYEEEQEIDTVANESPVERTETQAVLLPTHARLSGELIVERSSGTIANWKSEDGAAVWNVAHLKPGKYNVAIEHSVGMGRNGGRFEVSTGSGRMSGLARTTGGWKSFKRKPLGSIEIADGDTELRFVATNVEKGGSLMNIRSVELRRQ